MSPRAGKLRHYNAIEQPTDGQSTTGAVTLEPWTVFANRWMGFEVLSGREYLEGDARRTDSTGRFWLRDDVAGVTEKMRVAHDDGRKFNIQAIIPPEKPGGWFQLMVSEAK